MEINATASASVAAQAGQAQLATAAKLMRMSADQDANAAKLLDQAQQNAQRLANTAAGVGQLLDVSV